MFKGKTFLAVIPARGGSKRLPRKNVLDLAGKPLIAWTIDAAKNAKYIDKIIVSTDDEEIVGISTKYGMDVTIRPSELATDTASSLDVVIHAVDSQDIDYDYVIMLQPTSPLRTSKHVDEAVELLFKKEADAIISICGAEHSPLWANTLPEDGCMHNFIGDEVRGKRSQDLPQYYRLNGGIYIYDTNILVSTKNIFMKKTFSYFMSKSASVDIDDKYDFALANFLLEYEG